MRAWQRWRDEFVAWVKTLASAAVYATLIVTFGFQVARVEGQSMAPTLADQDRLIVNKLIYRLARAARGDIVMLYYPLNPDKSFVKRVIAEEATRCASWTAASTSTTCRCRDDYVPPEYRSHDDWGPQVIPEGYYFVMGDHRNNSSDSRHWGMVPKKYIIGKVQLRWWPVARRRHRRGARRQPAPDEDHPYGHRKFETMASLGILIFLVLVLVQVLGAAIERLRSGATPEVHALAFWVMGSTFLVNVAVVWYERSAGRRLTSEILLADAHHTSSDLLTSGAVILALVGVRLGYPWLDPVAALLVAGFIAHACWEIFHDTARILGDRIVIDESNIREVVQSVPEVMGCHQIRTRGPADFVFLDLHVWMDGDLPLHEAHRISHVVKDRLMARFPEIKDAVIHIEPPPASEP
jgi:signal peptidase I